MKKKLLILQFRTDKSLRHERDCFIKSGNFKKSDLHFVNILDSRSRLPMLDDLSSYCGVIIGGSGQTDICCWDDETKAKVVRIKKLVEKVINNDMPMLNICFGHQLVAYFLEGKVETDERQAETGTYEISLNPKGKQCPLFRDMPKHFYAVLGHKDSVTKLPVGANTLASSDRCHIESYRIKNNVYCVQFHPELDKKGMRYRLNLFPTYMHGKNIESILSNYKETEFASKVIANFRQFVLQN